MPNSDSKGFSPNDVDSFKVDAVANACHEQCPMLELGSHRERFKKSSIRGWPRTQDHCVFICVDSIEARRLIWESVRGVASFYADGRMTAEVIRVLAAGLMVGQFARWLRRLRVTPDQTLNLLASELTVSDSR